MKGDPFTEPEPTEHYPPGAEQRARARAERGSPGGFGPPLKHATLSDVFERWTNDGPLIHEATGIKALDDLTGGGPVYGSRWYIMGAPDAGKTALIVQIAHVLALRGVAVGILAVDEEDEDVATRLVQRTPMPGTLGHFLRWHCEDRSEDLVARMQLALGRLPIRFYGSEWTIEAAAADLDAFAKSIRGRAALFVDSIQAVECDACRAAGRELNLHAAITANANALRGAASRYHMLAVATCEMNRNAYRTVESADSYNDMAAAKESGKIEYSARVMLAVRLVKDEKDLIELRITKNKHGPSYPREPALYLRLDRERQELTLTEAPAPAAEQPSRRAKREEESEVLREQRRLKREAEQRAKAAQRETAAQAERDRVDNVVRQILAEGYSGRLRDEVIARATVGKDKADAAIARCRQRANAEPSVPRGGV
ncbi:MAG: DnaB-like helicase C-terminal domain-containing protein [Polyangiaceae bacterium]